MLDGEKHRFNVDVHDLVPFRGSAVFHTLDQHDTGVVDQVLYFLEAPDDLPECSHDVLFYSDVGGKELADSAAGTDLFGPRTPSLFIAIQQRDAGALVGKALGDAETDA